MADANETEQTESNNDAAYYKAEAKKAFEARDKEKQRVRELEAKVLGDDERALFERLKAENEKAEETRKRKAGEWDELKKQLTEKYTSEISARDSRINSLSDRFRDMVIRAEFGSAVDYFSGSETSKTILDVDLGMAYLGKHVSVEDTDDGGYRVIVKRPNGHVIIGDDGNPAPFGQAIGELIEALPNKDRILRGSGKTGSGSSGGSNRAAASADVTELTQRAKQGDKDALEQLRRRRNASGALVMGSAFTR